VRDQRYPQSAPADVYVGMVVHFLGGLGDRYHPLDRNREGWRLDFANKLAVGDLPSGQGSPQFGYFGAGETLGRHCAFLLANGDFH
jgi:hypothetical protein